MARRIRRTIGPLDARGQAILRAVIEEYVATATPVGSQLLVEKFRLGVSSATVRSILAELEVAGYLTHPHTSAGRVPTDRGYRYLVESMRGEGAPLSPVEQLMIRHQFGQVEFASDQWFRLAASAIASVTHEAGLATPAKPSSSRFRRVDLVALQERLASLILVLNEGTVRQTLVSTEPGTKQEQLTEIAGQLNDAMAGRSARELAWMLGPAGGVGWTGLCLRVAERVLQAVREADATAIEELFSDGLLNVMEAPEFAQSEKLRRVFSALENRAYLGDLVSTVTRQGGIHIYIGHENRPTEMEDVSLVLAPYGRPGRAVGVVGVLGPTRMSYPQAIGTVRFVSGLMNELVDHLYA